MIDIFDTPPDHESDEGLKHWFHKALTDYLDSKELIEDGYIIYAVELPDGERNFVLYLAGKPVKDFKTIDSVSTYIDALKLTEILK